MLVAARAAPGPRRGEQTETQINIRFSNNRARNSHNYGEMENLR